MRNRLRALSAVLPLELPWQCQRRLRTPIPWKNLRWPIVVPAHRKLAEGTLPAYKYAVKNRADILDADVRWTKDGPDPDNLGTMVILHDATLDRVTNCKGSVQHGYGQQFGINAAPQGTSRIRLE
jgi:glycerophosphoryl diester phosphodiesterase